MVVNSSEMVPTKLNHFATIQISGTTTSVRFQPHKLLGQTIRVGPENIFVNLFAELDLSARPI